MFIKKTCQRFFIFTYKSKHVVTNSVHRFFSVRVPVETRNKFSRYTKYILASATAFSLSLYIASRQYTLCETADIVEDKILDKVIDHDIYDEAIRKSRDLLQRIKDEVGTPGIVVGVSINGKTVWREGLGYADVENRVSCSPDTVMRIASISKSITMAAVAKLWEQGKLNIDKPVQDYVPYFPSKNFDGKPVTITCRQLVSHLGGIRHYEKNINESSSTKNDGKGKDEKLRKNEKSEFELKEYYIKEHFKDVKSSLDLFKDDPLIANPGSKFYYTTHGWTLISAIVEASSKEQFSTHMTKLFKALGMSSTYLDNNDVLIYHRSRNYIKDKNGRIMNAPYVDNSYKWAGGGFLSTVGDLLQFGNAMLYSLQFKPDFQNIRIEDDLPESDRNIKNMDSNTSNILIRDKNAVLNKSVLPGYLSSKTVESMWTPVTDAKEEKYGMGWFVSPEVNECMFCENKKLCVYHTGGAIGASSVLLIVPQKVDYENSNLEQIDVPKGTIVTILTNLQSVGLTKTALKIAHLFEDVTKVY